MGSEVLLMFGMNNDVYMYGLASSPTSKDIHTLISNSVVGSFERNWVQVNGRTVTLFKTRTRTVAMLGDTNTLLNSNYVLGKDTYVLSIAARINHGYLEIDKQDFNYMVDCFERNLFVTEHGFSNYNPDELDVDLRLGKFGTHWVDHGSVFLSNLLNHYMWLGFDKSGKQIIGDLVYARR